MKKRMGGILTALAAAFTTFSFVGCDLEVDNKDDRAAYIDTSTKTVTLTEAKTFAATETAGYTMKLGCDGSSMKVSSVKYNGTELMPDYTEYALSSLSWDGVNVSGLSADTWTVQYTYTMTSVGEKVYQDYNFEIRDDDTTDGALGYWSVRYDNYAVGWLHGYHEYGNWGLDHIEGVTETDAAYGGHWYGMTSAMDSYDHTQTLNKTLVMTVKKTSSAFVITITSDGEQIWTCTNDSTSSASASESEETETSFGWTGSVTGGSFWTVFAGDDVQVASGETRTTTMTITAVGSSNWECAPDIILRKADATEYGVLRADNYGWGTAVGEACGNITATSDWDWDNFVTFINGSTCKITVMNNGDGTAEVKYDFEKDGTTHYQYYTGIAVDATDLYVNLLFENCNATFTK